MTAGIHGRRLTFAPKESNKHTRFNENLKIDSPHGKQPKLRAVTSSVNKTSHTPPRLDIGRRLKYHAPDGQAFGGRPIVIGGFATRCGDADRIIVATRTNSAVTTWSSHGWGTCATTAQAVAKNEQFRVGLQTFSSFCFFWDRKGFDLSTVSDLQQVQKKSRRSADKI